MNRNCSNCYYTNNCKGCTPCDDYDPIGAFSEDAEIDALIESNRAEFHKEWNEYISEYDD